MFWLKKGVLLFTSAIMYLLFKSRLSVQIHFRYFHCIFPYVSSDKLQEEHVMTMSAAQLLASRGQQCAKVCMDVPHGLTEGVRGSFTLISSISSGTILYAEIMPPSLWVKHTNDNNR